MFTNPVDWLKTPSNGVKTHRLRLKTFSRILSKKKSEIENSKNINKGLIFVSRYRIKQDFTVPVSLNCCNKQQ